MLSSQTVGSLHTGKVQSVWICDYFSLAAFSTAAALTAYLTFWTRYKPRRAINPALNQHLPSSSPLVFTHQDLAPRNILIDDHNTLWLVDWESSGWYPVYFEYASMQNFEWHRWSWYGRFRWWIFSLISTGNYAHELKVLNSIRYISTRFPIARKSELKYQESMGVQVSKAH
jgi:hypothetical protein